MGTESTDRKAAFHKLTDKGKPVDTLDEVIVETLLKDFDLFVMNGKVYVYQDGVYEMDDELKYTKELFKAYVYTDLITHTRLNRLCGLLLSSYNAHRDNDEINNFPKTWVNFKNGFLDLSTMKMHSHSPMYLSINQIPFEWRDIGNSENESVTAEFLDGLLTNPSDREMFLEFAGYCLTTDMSLQKMLFLKGEGGIGKSELLHMVERIVGKKNISPLTVQNLNDRFSPAFLFGKLLNSYADVSSEAMGDVSGIKTIVGQDNIRAEYKGGAVFSFKPYCKLLFSANRIPASNDDKTCAYYRRLLVLKIEKRCHHIVNLSDRIEADTETFLHMAVDAAHRMYERGEITESESSKAAVQDLYIESDSVIAFLIDRTEKAAAEQYIQRGQLYISYCEYCEYEERTPKTRNAFFANLRDKGYCEKQVMSERCFYGICYKR